MEKPGMNELLPYDHGVFPTKPPPEPGDTLLLDIEGLPPYKDTHYSIRNPKHKVFSRFAALRKFAIEAMASRAFFKGAVSLEFEMRAPSFEKGRSLMDYMGGIMDTLDGSHGLSFTYLPIMYEDDCQVCVSESRLVRDEHACYSLRVTFLPTSIRNEQPACADGCPAGSS